MISEALRKAGTYVDRYAANIENLQRNDLTTTLYESNLKLKTYFESHGEEY